MKVVCILSTAKYDTRYYCETCRERYECEHFAKLQKEAKLKKENENSEKKG